MKLLQLKNLFFKIAGGMAINEKNYKIIEEVIEKKGKCLFIVSDKYELIQARYKFSEEVKSDKLIIKIGVEETQGIAAFDEKIVVMSNRFLEKTMINLINENYELKLQLKEAGIK